MEILYVCSLCGWSNQCKESVERCERNHTKKEDIIIDSVGFIEGGGNGIPDFIFVNIRGNDFKYKLI